MKAFLCSLLALAIVTLTDAAGSPLLGIDIGSDFMKIAIVQPGRPFQIVTNTATKRKTEVMVGFDDDGNHLFAGDAKNRFTRKPQQVYRFFRNLLGRKPDHPHAKQVINTFLGFFKPGQNERRGTINFPAVDIEGDYQIEEIMAMLLEYARDQGEAFAEGNAKIKDCVITVPSYFTQFERQAIFDAAKIIDLHVLGIIDENTAAAVQYGIDKKHNGTYKVLFYNLGAESAQASLVYFSTKNMRKRGTNITASTFHVKGKASATGLGGLYLTSDVANKFGELFNEQQRKRKKTDDYDVLTKQRPMAKLFAAADKIKKKLSANKGMGVYVQSVDKDDDFKGIKLDRALLEKMGEDKLQRVLDPITEVLDNAKLEPTDVDIVELIGGGLRVPKVQSMLCEMFNCKDKENGVETAIHLNGDEAMALGAAFVAANKSQAFRVRFVGAGDTCPFPIGVRIKQIGDEKNEKGKIWSKRASLFKRNNKLMSRKVVTFKYAKSFRVEMHYEKNKAIPAGTPKILGAYNISGVEEIVADEKYENLGTPKIKVSFFLDGNQMVTVVKADALFEETITEMVEVEIEDEPENHTNNTDSNATEASERKLTEDKKESESEKTEGKDGESEKDTEEGGDEKTEGADDKKTDESKSDEQNEKDEEEGEEGKESDEEEKKKEEEPQKKKTRMEERTRKKIHTVPLKIKAIEDVLEIKSMNADDLKIAKERFQAYKKLARERRELATARNNMETLIYESKEKLNDNEDKVKEVTEENFFDDYLAKLSELVDWIYFEDDAENIENVNTKTEEIKGTVNGIFFKIAESTNRPKAVKVATELIAATRTKMAGWPSNRPQVTEQEINDLEEKLGKLEAYLNEKVEAQSALAAKDEPAFTSNDVAGEIKGVSSLLKRLLKKAPLPPPEEDEDEEDEEEGKVEAGDEKADENKGDAPETDEQASKTDAADKDSKEEGDDGKDSSDAKKDEESNKEEL